MNSFVNEMNELDNFNLTENGAIAHKSTMNKVYDLFARGGSMRGAPTSDCVLLFKEAFKEDKLLALKCLFFIRDIRGGLGERRFFKDCMTWLANEYPDVVKKNLRLFPEYGRWDDLFCLFNTPVEKEMLSFIKEQLALDVQDVRDGKNGISLLAKWLKSCNTSNKESREIGNKIRSYLGMTQKQYRKILSALRSTINIVEKLMSEGRWEEINFAKLPSRAGFIYRNAFARNDLIGEKYREFINSKETKVHAGTLYPYDIVRKALAREMSSYYIGKDKVEREAINKYWENLPDYLNGKPCKMICVCDTSGSMTGGYGCSVRPIDVAISLSMYCAERIGGDFKNHYISFASRPQWIEIRGIDFVDKANGIYQRNLCDDTNIEATFNLIKKAMKQSKPEDWPTSIVIISDMQINHMTIGCISEDRLVTDMEAMRLQWAKEGLTLPKLVYWNVNAAKPTILDKGPDVSFVSGASPVLFEQILKGMSGWEMCLDKLNSERYSAIRV